MLPDHRLIVMNALARMFPKAALKRYRTRDGEWDQRAIAASAFNEIVRDAVVYARSHKAEEEAFRRTLPVMPTGETAIHLVNASSDRKSFHCENHGKNRSHATEQCKGKGYRAPDAGGRAGTAAKAGSAANNPGATTGKASAAPVTGSTKKKQWCSNCGYEVYHKPEKCFSKRWVCRTCGERGHLQKMCPKKDGTTDPKNGDAGVERPKKT